MEISKKGPDRSLTQARLKELFEYDQLTGIFTRRIATGRHGCHKAGEIAGTHHPDGCVHIGLNHTTWKAHRLAWLYVHGAMPTGVIDHINGNRSDNRIANLRDVTQSVNLQNMRRAKSTSKTGFLGAVPLKNGRFAACLVVDGRNKQVGVYPTPELAHQAYVAAKRQLHQGNTL